MFAKAVLAAVAVGLADGAAATAAVDAVDADAFAHFKRRFGKAYDTPAEDARRAAVFHENRRKVAAANDPTLGVTKFSDLTEDEFDDRFLGLRPNLAAKPVQFWDGSCPACARFPAHRDLAAADSFDWTTKGAVTAVKTQHCGDCYAFASAADIEGAWFLAGHDLTSLSEEQIVDCCWLDAGLLQCAGCSGGDPNDVFDWLLKNYSGGICAEADYPYTVPTSHPAPGSCQRSELKNSTFAAHIDGWYWVSHHSSNGANGGEQNMTTQLPLVGPFSIGFDAKDANLQHYTGGIAQPSCKPDPVLTHAMLVVGYGVEDGTPYWRLKNSYGTDFGEDGYYRVVRGQNACGIANLVAHSYVNH